MSSVQVHRFHDPVSISYLWNVFVVDTSSCAFGKPTFDSQVGRWGNHARGFHDITGRAMRQSMTKNEKIKKKEQRKAIKEGLKSRK